MVMEKYHATTKYSIESFISTQPLNITIHQRLITSLNSWRNDFVYYIFQIYIYYKLQTAKGYKNVR